LIIDFNVSDKYNDMVKQFLEKRIKTNIEKYGVEHTSQRESNRVSVREKLYKRCPDPDEYKRLVEVEKWNYKKLSDYFNVSNTALRNWNIEYNLKPAKLSVKIPLPPKEDLVKHYNLDGMSLNDIAKLYNTSNVTVSGWFDKYQISKRSQSQVVTIASPKISEVKLAKYGFKHFPLDMEYHQSKAEIHVRDYLNSLGFDFISDRTILSGNKSLDMYDKKIGIAIEYNGENWHTEYHKDKVRSYHYSKFKECADAGIKLIMINHKNEWNDRNKQIKDFLKATLGIFEHRIYARCCTVKKLDYPNRQFLDNSHIQGAPKKILSMYGLFYGDLLVGGVTYSVHHRNNKQVTLSRLCFLPGFQIIGGASKLVKNSIKSEGFTEVITWSDNRFTNGELYKKMGFTNTVTYGPDYVYVDIKTSKIYSKQSQQKKKTNCPSEITESEWAKTRGLYRMWDCGKKKWVIEIHHV
jgi:hypothetical protein